MSETVKLVIEIPKDLFERIYQSLSVPDMQGVDIVNAINVIKNGTPLDDVKAEIEKLDEGITSYHNDKPWVYKSEALGILDNIGKGE